jgi:hypothetical protein
MRIESINGVNRVYLDEGEKLLVSTLGLNEEEVVNIQNNNHHLDVAFPFDKVEEAKIDPAISELCVSWVNWYRDFMEGFKKVTEEEDVRIVLRTGLFLPENNHSHGKFLTLYLTPTVNVLGKGIQGSQLRIDDRNEDIFKYLYAWSVALYIYHNYRGVEVNEFAFENSKSLWSGAAELGLVSGNNRKAYADLGSIIQFDDTYEKIVKDLIKVHNKNCEKGEWVYNEVIYPIGAKIKSCEDKDFLLEDSVNRSKMNYELFELDLELDKGTK